MLSYVFIQMGKLIKSIAEVLNALIFSHLFLDV